MPAPKGNNYWNFVGKHGRNHKYTPSSLWKEAIQYFEWISQRVWNKNEAIKSGDMAGVIIKVPTSTPMSIESFCLFADISYQTFLNYESNEGTYKAFFEVTTRIRKTIEAQQFEGATVGAYNQNIIARKLGLADKTDITSLGDKLENNVTIFKLPDNGREKTEETPIKSKGKK